MLDVEDVPYVWHNAVVAIPTAETKGSTKGELSAAHLVDEVERTLARSPEMTARIREPNLLAAREAAGRLYDLIGRVGSKTVLIEVKGSEAAVAEARRRGSQRTRTTDETAMERLTWKLAGRALLRCFDAFLALVTQQAELAALDLVDAWLVEAQNLAGSEGGEARAWGPTLEELRSETARRRGRQHRTLAEVLESPEWLVLFSQAAEEVIARSWSEGQARTALRSLMTHLDLGQDELGRLFGVSGETVRRWERGKSRISSGSEAAILAVDSAARRLLEIFRPGRLALVLRRKAELFEGETALEWILRGRVDEVVERYERTFLYQA